MRIASWTVKLRLVVSIQHSSNVLTVMHNQGEVQYIGEAHGEPHHVLKPPGLDGFHKSAS